MERNYAVKDLADLLKVAKTTVIRRAARETWPYLNGNGRGGEHRKYAFDALPGDIQAAIIKKEGTGALGGNAAPEALLAAADQLLPVPTFDSIIESGLHSPSGAAWTPETALNESDLRDPRIKRILAILREAGSPPRGWAGGRRKWMEGVALRNGCTFQSVYRWQQKYEKRGIAGLRHSKSTAGSPRAWSPEAVEFWIGLCLKRDHRKIDRRVLYDDILIIEAHRRGWRIGSYASANWWFDKKATPQLLALQKGGLRALDNLLPPILRDYSDLAPFEILVGDQHRWDFWVVDDVTGEVFRPEGYYWQDLRTRVIYGGAVGRKYDSWMIGMALRIGAAVYGLFSSIYTDNGKPECSRYLTGILADIRALGAEWNRTDDLPMDVLDVDPDEVNPLATVGVHRKAIVKNAKAKMIEGTFNVVEDIIRSRFRLPGYVKRLSDDTHHQDIDQDEARDLAVRGKLPLFSEFVLVMYRALDWYNREKHHRGVSREWAWKPVPKTTTPYDCLMACHSEGWRPKAVSREAADLLFMARTTRTVHLGRIDFARAKYEADALVEYNGEKVDLRYNPMDPEELHVFRGGRYLCTAVPVEYSSMKDGDLANRKIREKREKQRHFHEEFKRITSPVPDYRNYSAVPAMEKVAALVGAERKRRADENREFYRPLSAAELDEKVAELEAIAAAPPVRPARPLPERPMFFIDALTRFTWCMDYLKAGGTLSEEDRAFRAAYEAAMTPEQKEYWSMYIEYGG